MRAGLPARVSQSTARKEDRLFDDETDAEVKPASNFYASEQISECAVTESTRTLIVAPGVIPGAAGKIAVLNCGVLPASIQIPRRAGPSTSTAYSLPIIARLRASEVPSWSAMTSASRLPFSSSLTLSPSRNARVCWRTEYLNVNAES